MTASFRLGPLRQVNLVAADLGRAVAFYRDILGLPLLATFGGLAFFDLAGVRLLLQVGERQAAAQARFCTSRCRISARRTRRSSSGACRSRTSRT